MQVTQPLLYAIIYKASIGIAVTGVGTLMLWPIRKARSEWVALKDAVIETKKELETQRTNCLATLSQQGATQIEILGKVADTLEGVRLDLKEQTGFIQGLTLSPRKRYAKK
jgi:hypothetical protein